MKIHFQLFAQKTLQISTSRKYGSLVLLLCLEETAQNGVLEISDICFIMHQRINFWLVYILYMLQVIYVTWFLI